MPLPCCVSTNTVITQKRKGKERKDRNRNRVRKVQLRSACDQTDEKSRMDVECSGHRKTRRIRQEKRDGVSQD